MKQFFASFFTKPLKYKICPNFAAVNDNLKILAYFCHFYNRPLSILKSLEMFTFFPNFRLADFYFREFGLSTHQKDHFLYEA